MKVAKIILILTAMCLTACGESKKYMEEFSENNASVNSGESVQTEEPSDTAPAVAEASLSESDAEVNEMKISINGTEYTVLFYDTKAAEEFKAMLPLTLNMSELNGNEKYFYLDSELTAAGEKVGSIKKGELMLYGGSCVVLFYESFSTPYSYTRLGYIDDPAGLENTVGPGSVTVEFYAE